MAYIDLISYIQEGIAADPPVAANYYFQEESQPYNRQSLVPGHFYTFTVVNRVPNDLVPNESETKSALTMEKYPVKRPYYDNRPVCLSLGNNGGGGEIVLNLKMIPPKFRSIIIRKYMSVIKDRLQGFYQEDELMPFIQRLRPDTIGPFLNVNAAFLSKLTGMNLSFALNKYQREQMANVGLIDWEDVSKIERIDYRTDPFIAVKTPVSILLNNFGK